MVLDVMNISKTSVKLTVAVLATSVVSALTLSACGNSPDENTVAKYMPADTLAFVTVALEPSVIQKAALAKASQKLPQEVRTDKADEVKDKLLSGLFNDEEDINYETDIKPWLGNEAAVAVLPPIDGDTPAVVAAVQTDDEAEATKVLNEQKVDKSLYRFIEGYMFFAGVDEDETESAATSKKILDRVQGVVDGADSLQDNKVYKGNLDDLHGQHIVLGWVDLPALTKRGVEAVKKFDDTMGGVESEFETSGIAHMPKGALKVLPAALSETYGTETETEELSPTYSDDTSGLRRVRRLQRYDEYD